MKSNPKPLIYLHGGFWCISPSGSRNAKNNVIASNTFLGACRVAEQCYNPWGKWR